MFSGDNEANFPIYTIFACPFYCALGHLEASDRYKSSKNQRFI
jgi:hypothetical protein